MAKIRFRSVHLSKANKERLDVINQIIEEYQAQGYTLTLRQLYYQLVSRDVVPNKVAEYAKLSTLLKEGRMGGIVDWDAIEDRLRKPSSPASWANPQSIMRSVISQYALPRQEGQNVYLEVWVEKDALSGVLKRVTERFHVPILVNRGYSSASAMFDSYERFIKAFERGQTVVLLYLGDYDPSGIDMIRDINDRIVEFLQGSEETVNIFDELDEATITSFVQPYVEIGTEEDIALLCARDAWVEKMFSIVPIALTREQIRQYNPPPNPAKLSDPRAKDFVKLHGATSWEVDALKPEVLNELLESSIREYIDFDAYQSIVDREEADKKRLREITKNL